MRMLKFFLAAVVPFALLGCPDKASPDPAAGKGSATPAAKAGGSAAPAAAAPAKSGGW